jgi:hypothetical protein
VTDAGAKKSWRQPPTLGRWLPVLILSDACARRRESAEFPLHNQAVCRANSAQMPGPLRFHCRAKYAPEI